MNLSSKFFNMILFNLIICACIFIIYILPVSSNMNLSDKTHYDVYYYSRLLLAGIALPIIIRKLRVRWLQCFEYLVLAAIMLVYIFINDKIPWTGILVFSFIIIIDWLLSQKKANLLNSAFIKKLIICASIFYIAQIALVVALNPTRVGLLSSCKDANYTGYFLVLLYFLVDSIKKGNKLFHFAGIFLTLAFLTYSRAAFLAVSIIKFCKLVKLKSRFIEENPAKCFYIILMLWVSMGILYINHFESIEYQYRSIFGINRFLNYIDFSNYIRFVTNWKLIANISFPEIILGYTDHIYYQIIFFENKSIFPHNLFFAIYAHAGVLFALSIVHRLVSIFKGYRNITCLFLVVVMYAMVLGPSVFYGVDLIIIFTILQLGNSSNICTAKQKTRVAR